MEDARRPAASDSVAQWAQCVVRPTETDNLAEGARLATRDGAAVLNLPPGVADTSAAGCARLPLAAWGADLLGYASPTEVAIRVGQPAAVSAPLRDRARASGEREKERKRER